MHVMPSDFYNSSMSDWIAVQNAHEPLTDPLKLLNRN